MPPLPPLPKPHSRTWAAAPEDVSKALSRPGTIVAMSRRTAEACGALEDDCISAEEATEAMLEPLTHDPQEPDQPAGRSGAPPSRGKAARESRPSARHTRRTLASVARPDRTSVTVSRSPPATPASCCVESPFRWNWGRTARRS